MSTRKDILENPTDENDTPTEFRDERSAYVGSDEKKPRGVHALPTKIVDDFDQRRPFKLAEIIIAERLIEVVLADMAAKAANDNN